ncbi:MAG: sulfoacetaldehyde dehydrogenase [Parvicella sp.]|jgi:sulfoacetaldehyde dehydrogenase
MMSALSESGAVMLNDTDRLQLASQLWQDGKLNQSLIAKKAYEMAELANLGALVNNNTKVLLVQTTGIGKGHPYSGEKLSPVLTVYKAKDFNEAKAIASEIMAFQGQGHSISIHTNDDTRPLELGLNLPICRVIVNQIHCYATGGSFDNALPFSLSMGCGTWGENSISDNMNYTHYLNTTRVVRTIAPNEPSVEDIFAEYWQAHDIQPQAM